MIIDRGAALAGPAPSSSFDGVRDRLVGLIRDADQSLDPWINPIDVVYELATELRRSDLRYMLANLTAAAVVELALRDRQLITFLRMEVDDARPRTHETETDQRRQAEPDQPRRAGRA